jgi:V-type H+-transporting ATPase subunit a
MLTGVAVYLYYSMYYTSTDPVLPHDLTVNIDHPTGYQELLPHDENNVLLRHNVELYDSSSSGSGSNDGNHGKNNLYHIKVHETTSIEISTSYYSTLSSLLYQSPLYKAVAMRQGLILWFLMISLCSTYVGFIYNDAAANPLFIFNSYLQTQHNAHGGISYDKYTVYPFGLDPGWFHTKQELTFLNSFKMKMAIIIGIIHLYSGIISNIFNHIYFKHYPDLILSTLPQLLLLSCTFGYMSVLIIYKWCIDYRYYGQLFHDGKIDVLWSPVSIIQTIINMFLSPGGPIPQSMLMFSGQSQLQLLFVLISALCVPMLFIGEPLYTWFKHKKWARTYSPSILTPEEEIALNYSNRYNNNDLNDGVGGNTEVIRRLNSTQGSKNNLQSSNPSYSTFGSDDNDVDVNNINDSTDDGNGTDNDDVLHTYGNTKTKHSSTKLLISPSGRSVPSGRHSPSGLPRLPSPSSSGQNVKQFEEQHDHEVSEDDQLDPFNRHYTLSTHFVHHGIHTIEFVLGIVSNTASYLRLWALSLAHAQLSSVFWTQLITNIGLGPQSGPIGLVIAVMVWLIATVAVLLMMDFMEVALHCTRLHWVEAQSKFFRGGGYLFNPFSLHQQEEKK